ncbi:MAG: RluA family pseudouridine synthase [Rhodospirillales bacterium]|nr:RluA family pseudouridine synthase [Rhodospirillales bacterium]
MPEPDTPEPDALEPDEAVAAPDGRAEPVRIGEDEAGQRLDRWFKRHYPHTGHGQLEKLLRTGQVRVDGHRAKSGDRLEAGQRIRVPPSALIADTTAQPRALRLSRDEAADLEARILYRDAEVLVIDKPAGLAVQGGTKTSRHLDGMLDALRFGAERPRLVHRLDKDTAGALVLARTAVAAARLTAAFRQGTVRKLYWAVVVGLPAAAAGRIDQALAKHFGAVGERVGADDDGRPAITDYRVVERAGRNATWLALEPHTGRTHQLRAHCALIGTPILGDGKYGGAAAFLESEGLGERLHLLARSVRFTHPGGGEITVTAPLPPHMRATWRFFGFSEHAVAEAQPHWGDEAARPRSPRRPPGRRGPSGRPSGGPPGGRRG